jgi:dGTPase
MQPPEYIASFDAKFPLELRRNTSAEAQVAAFADDIAYNTHDLDDGLRAGLFDFADILDLPLVGDLLREAQTLTPQKNRVRHELSRRVINAVVHDVIATSEKRLAALAPTDAEAIRDAAPVIGFSPEMAEASQAIKSFLFERMYRHWRVNRMTHKAKMVTKALGSLLLERPYLLPEDWRVRAGKAETEQAAAAVRDYVAGMTDNYALEEYAKLTDPSVRA